MSGQPLVVSHPAFTLGTTPLQRPGPDWHHGRNPVSFFHTGVPRPQEMGLIRAQRF